MRPCCLEAERTNTGPYLLPATTSVVGWVEYVNMINQPTGRTCQQLSDNIMTQVRGFKPGRSRRIFKGEKILSTPSFGGEVKPSVPWRRFAACKRSLQLCGSRIVDGIYRDISRPRRVPPSATRGLSRRWTWRHLAKKVGTSKGRGKQWQPTPKNLPRMQWASAIPVAWLGSGSC
jgi:hypothetical protein